MGNEVSDAFFPQTYEEASWNNTGDHASSNLQKFKHLLCIQLGLVVAHLCPWRLNGYLPNIVIVPLQHMLLDPANGSTTDLDTQIENGAWSLTTSSPLSPAPVDLPPKRSWNLSSCFQSTGQSYSHFLTEPCSSLLIDLSAFFKSLLLKLFFPLHPEQSLRTPNLMESLPYFKFISGVFWLLGQVQTSYDTAEVRMLSK